MVLKPRTPALYFHVIKGLVYLPHEYVFFLSIACSEMPCLTLQSDCSGLEKVAESVLGNSY